MSKKSCEAAESAVSAFCEWARLNVLPQILRAGRQAERAASDAHLFNAQFSDAQPSDAQHSNAQLPVRSLSPPVHIPPVIIQSQTKQYKNLNTKYLYDIIKLSRTISNINFTHKKV
ncbi:MAG: hypothetical protein HDR29_08125 [Lachnospiraceae bacterium]|nr:hypothetical protein [Lachnospiraceae bacterium]